MKPKKTTEKYEKFLSALRETGSNVARACEAEGVSRATAYEWRKTDEDFAARWDSAAQEAIDELEQEARRRAVEGVEEPVFYGGKIIGTKREYSDTLLMFLLKCSRPEKYKDRSEAVSKTGKDLISSITVNVVKSKK